MSPVEWAAAAAFLWAFAEATFFPLPPEVLLIPLILFEPETLLPVVIGALLGSLCGGTATFFWARQNSIRARERLPRLVGVAPRMVDQADQWLGRYRDEAVAFSSWTGIPYKVFAALSGTRRGPLLVFLWVSFLARALRLLAVGWLTQQAAFRWGEEMRSRWLWVSLGYTAAAAVLYGIHQWFWSRVRPTGGNGMMR